MTRQDSPTPTRESSRTVVALADRWRARLSRGQRAAARGDHRTAVEHLQQALRLAPDRPEVLLALGRAQLHGGDLAEAERCLSRAHELQPTSAAAAAALARLLGLHLDRRQQAFAVLHRTLEASDGGDDEPAELHVIRGELLLDEGAIAEARAAFARALDRDRSAAAARTGLARTFNAEGIAASERGDEQRAAFLFKRAADTDPRWATPHVNLGVVFSRLGNVDRAIAAYTGALERDPHNPVACANLAGAQHERGQPARAIELLEHLMSFCPEYPGLRVSLANALSDVGQYDQAVALLLEELESDPASVEAWANLGLAYVCAGNTDRGEECLRRALACEPSYFIAHHNLAVLYATQGREGEAARVLRRAYDIDPQRTRGAFSAHPSFAGLRAREPFRFLQ